MVAVDEIRMGDNDLLSAYVAHLTEADALIILTDVDGLHDGRPGRGSAASRLDMVEAVTPEIRRLAGRRPGSAVGSGGMLTKIRAAEMVTKAGHAVLIARGTDERVLVRAVKGEPLGTLFMPSGRRMPSRKRWLAFGVKTLGAIVVDAGARTALLERGKSLLPRGVVGVSGTFEKGDPVAIEDASGREFGRGLAEYSSGELERIKGLSGGDIGKTLGFTRGDEVVHRDHMVLLSGEDS
jgi:glutamate 5-kinase